MFKILSTKTNTIGKTALLLTIFMLSSSVLAVVRDKIFSTKFGAGEILDTYMAAFKIPDLVFLLVGTLISSFVIIPMLEKEEKEGKQLQVFINKLFFTFFTLISLVSLAVFLTLPILAPKFFPGFSADQIENLVSMARVMLLSPIFISLAAVFGSVNQKNNYFFPTALTGVFYNISIILATLFLYPIFGFSGVVFGVVFGAFLYLILQLPPILKENRFISKLEFFNWKEIKKIVRISAPRSVALVIADVLLIFLIAKATLLGEGSVTILNFSLNIFLVPISIIAVSYSVAVFPKLAKAYAIQNMDNFKELSRDIISRILFFGIPISIYFVFFSESIVGFLLGSEKFGLSEISKTALLVSVFALGIVFQALVIMMVRIFYAMGRTWIPLIANIFLAIVMVSLLFMLQIIFPAGILPGQGIQINGLFILALVYMIAFFIDFLIIALLFKETTANFSLFKKSQWIKKLAISLVAIGTSKIVFDVLRPEIKNSFTTFFIELALSGIVFVISIMILSEVLKEKNYLMFKQKIITIYLSWRSK